MKTIIFGLTVLIGSVSGIPSFILSKIGLESIHTGMLGQLSKPLAVAISFFSIYGVAFGMAIGIISLLKLKGRIPNSVVANYVINISAAIIILPSVLQILTSSVPGGGVTFAMAMLLWPLLLVSKYALILGFLYLLVEIKPSGKYTYET